MSEYFDVLINIKNRNDALGDASRRFVVALNTGDIIATLYIAGKLSDKCFNPTEYLGYPFAIFIFGLTLTGFSVFFAKHKGLLKLRYAGEQQDSHDTTESEDARVAILSDAFISLHRSNFIFDIAAGFIFLLGAINEWRVLETINYTINYCLQ